MQKDAERSRKRSGPKGRTPVESEAQTVIDFIETFCRVTAGESSSGTKAGELIKLRPWQKEIIRGIYGPQANGRRVVRTALLTMGRKNGKTELIAALCLAHLCGPVQEPNGQIYSAAADQEQAAMIFNAAASMVTMDVTLSGMLNIIESRKRMVHMASGSFYQAISSESKTKHGFNASVILYDELAQAPNRKLYDVLTTSTGARGEPLTIVISTQSADPLHIMSELVEYGRKVLAGTIDDRTFRAFIYEVPKDADIWDEANWYLANPALGDFRSLEEIRTYAARARRMPSAESSFRNLYLNQQIDAEGAWISVSDWQAVEHYLDAKDYAGREAYGAIDLSGKNDLTALSLAFPTETGIDALQTFWTPQEGLRERDDRDRVPYVQWHQEGHLVTTPGRSIDYAYVAQRIYEIRRQVDLKALAFDRWRIDDLINELDEIGVTTEIVQAGAEPEGNPDLVLIPHGQGYKDMSPAVEALETAVLNGTIRVQKNPVMTMCALNAVCTMDPTGSRKFDKRPGKSTGRIDGIVSLAMAVRCVTAAPNAGPSVYEQRGVVML